MDSDTQKTQENPNKSVANDSAVKRKLETMIGTEVGRIRRDANGNNQTYYFTAPGIAECGGKDLTIQVDYTFATDTITYHGYPDDKVVTHVLSRSKGGTGI